METVRGTGHQKKEEQDSRAFRADGVSSGSSREELVSLLETGGSLEFSAQTSGNQRDACFVACSEGKGR